MCTGPVDNGLAFLNAHPLAQLQNEYLECYRTKGSSQGLIAHMNSHLDQYITIQQNLEGCEHVMLEDGQYLADRMDEVMGNYDYKAAAKGMLLGEADNSVLINGPLGPKWGGSVTIYPSPGTTSTIEGKDLVEPQATDNPRRSDWPVILIIHSSGLFFSLMLFAFLTIYVMLITHPDSTKTAV